MRLFVATHDHQSAATLRDSWKVLAKGYKKSDMHQEVGRVLWNELEPSFQVRPCIVHVPLAVSLSAHGFTCMARTASVPRCVSVLFVVVCAIVCHCVILCWQAGG